MEADENGQGIARAFVAARAEGRALEHYPGTRPATLDEAYRVQDAALALHGGTIAGWKVGKIAPPQDGQERLSGPIYPEAVVEGDGHAMPVFPGGFAAAEAEFLLRIGTAPEPGKTRFTNDEARALVDAVHIGIEIASSPWRDINADGPRVTVADFGNNNGLIVGDAIEGWRDVDLDAVTVELFINDAPIGRATTATMLDGPFGAVRFLAENLASRGIPLTPGQWVSTGAVTGVHEVAIGDRVEARFGEHGRIGCTIKPATGA